MSDDGKHELCREVGRCHAVIMQQEQIIAVLRAEVKAWRDAEIDERKWRALDKARAATNAAKAMEET